MTDVVQRPDLPTDALLDAVGVGVDVVGVAAFTAQLAEPGTRFASVFTPGERRTAATRPDPGASLAARWAAKEAVVKAWGSAHYGRPDQVARDHVDLRDVEVRSDSLGRTSVRLHGAVATALAEHEVLVSLSHDVEADVAVAYAVLRPRGTRPADNPDLHETQEVPA